MVLKACELRMRVLISIFSISVIVILLFSGCTDDSNPVNSKNSTANLSGVVMAYFCGVGDVINNTSVNPRYTAQTGYVVPVSFIKSDGFTYDVTTDDSSEFSLTVDTGIYKIAIQLAHNYPDTFYNVHIDKDTALDLNLVYDFYFSDTIVISFQTENTPEDIIAEREDIVLLNSLISDMIKPDAARRDTIFVPTKGIVAHYYVPLSSNSLLWEVYENAYLTYGANTDLFSNEMGFNPGYYICY